MDDCALMMPADYCWTSTWQVLLFFVCFIFSWFFITASFWKIFFWFLPIKDCFLIFIYEQLINLAKKRIFSCFLVIACKRLIANFDYIPFLIRIIVSWKWHRWSFMFGEMFNLPAEVLGTFSGPKSFCIMFTCKCKILQSWKLLQGRTFVLWRVEAKITQYEENDRNINYRPASAAQRHPLVANSPACNSWMIICICIKKCLGFPYSLNERKLWTLL